MKKCEGCGQPHRYKAMMHSLASNYRPLICTSCGMEHTISFRSRLLIGASLALPVPLVVSITSNTFWPNGFLLYFMLVLLIFPLLPFAMR